MTLIVKETAEYQRALDAIRDGRARGRIIVRSQRLASGNPGDVKSVGDGVSELRINYGPGYRVYYTQVGKQIVLLLTCGDKTTQDSDIATAKALKSDYT